MGKKSPSHRTTIQERNIIWMITSPDPTPLSFFQYSFPTHRVRAIQRYYQILNLALSETDDPEVLYKLKKMKRTVNEARILFDWETWMQQKSAILVHRSVCNTNVHIHEEINKTSFSFESGEDEETNESEDDVKDNNEDHENEYGKSEDVEEDQRVKVDKDSFVQEFEKIPESSKLKLKSGRLVEDILFDYVKDRDYEQLKIEELFSDEEWAELTKDNLGIPQVPLNIAKEIARYGNKNLEQLRKTVMESYLPSDVSYDNDQHSDLEWIQMAIRTIVHLYENGNSPLQRNQYEYWYTIVLFGTCIDMLFRDSKLGTDVKRSDVPSYASSNRKNRNKRTYRKLVGRKIDGIIYLIEELYEMGAIEGARSYAGIHDKKYLDEYFKLPKSLRDMLADLMKALNYNSMRTAKVQVFGIIHLGLRVQFSRLWSAGGSIAIFKKDHPLYELPHNFSNDKFMQFLKFLVSTYQYKMILKNNIQVLHERKDNEDTLLDELLNVGRQQTPPTNTTVNYFADCFRTPRKVRRKKA
ncbi:10206_t:CDS:2 [Cetraspora pellucida]|uniref:10206_t:CDS:1 n=1 Tax=Cetraspora pellucida TaxID=1433469 RepID=A0A9N9CJB0_9GLOM|nr:10206_t:CDS:2 [Cetraspora pellucida]